MWALGRAASLAVLKLEDPSYAVVVPSDIPMEGRPTPRSLTVAEIHEYVRKHREVAENAYLFDQFLQDTVNKRTDVYGGSIENRCRFSLEAIGAVAEDIGQERTAIRVSPWSRFQGVLMRALEFPTGFQPYCRHAHGETRDNTYIFSPHFAHSRVISQV